MTLATITVDIDGLPEEFEGNGEALEEYLGLAADAAAEAVQDGLIKAGFENVEAKGRVS